MPREVILAWLVATFIAATGLSKEFAELKSLSPMTRLEVGGMSVLLNIAKLPDKKYAKSLALPWQTFAAKRRVGKMEAIMGRGAVGRRFRGKLMLAADALELWDDVLEFVNHHRGHAANVLVDSLWPKMTALSIMADIHVCALMEHVCWAELSARGSLLAENGTDIGPLGAAELNNQLWAFGTLMQSPDDALVLSVLAEGFTPFKDDEDAAARKWRAHRDSGKAKQVGGGRMAHSRHKLRGDTLRAFRRDGDWGKYQPFFVKCMRLMGEGIHESLTRTCADQLNHLKGICSPDHAEEWLRDVAKFLSCHDDRCESPFAFAKRLVRHFPNLKTWRAGSKACARMNHFFDLPDQARSSQYKTAKTDKGALGPAWTLPPPLMGAIRAWGKEGGEFYAAWDKEDTAKAESSMIVHFKKIWKKTEKNRKF